MKNISIGLVTVLFKSDDVLDDFFKSLSIQNFQNYKLYLVDNSYNKESLDLINSYLLKYNLSDKSVYINSGSNVGIAEGNNIGIKKSIEDKSDFTLLLNNDICFDNPNLLEDLIDKSIESNYSLVSTKIYYYNSNKIWFIDGIFNYNKVNVNHLYDGVEDVGQFNEITQTDYSPTCFMLVHNDVFHKIGLMDKSYFVYMDDVDFVYRAKKVGYSINMITTLKIEHKIGNSTGGFESVFSFKYSLRNRIYFARKFYSLNLKLVGISYVLLAFLYKAIKHKRLKVYFTAVKEGFSLKVGNN